MEILLVLVAGVLIGAKFFPIKLKKLNEKIQVILIAFLIFAMGISLGNREKLLDELLRLGTDSLVLAIISIVCSSAVVFILTKKWK